MLTGFLKDRGFTPTYTYAVPSPQPKNGIPNAALIKAHAPALQEKVSSFDGAVLLLGKVPLNALFPKKGYRKTVGSWIDEKHFVLLDPGKVFSEPFQFNNFIWQLDRFEKRDVPPIHTPSASYYIARSREEVDRIFEILGAYGPKMLMPPPLAVAIDIETTGKNNFDHTTARISAIGLGVLYPGEKTNYIIPPTLVYTDATRDGLRGLIEAGMGARDPLNFYPRILAHNGKFDFKFLMTHLGVPYRVDVDTQILHYAKNEQGAEDIKTSGKTRDAGGGHRLKLLTRLYLGWDDYSVGVKYNPTNQKEWDDLLHYLALDVQGVIELYTSPLMWEDDRQKKLHNLYRPISALFSDMESRGVLLDQEKATALRDELLVEEERLTESLRTLAWNNELNPGSNPDLFNALYHGSPWSLPKQYSKKTGALTLDEDALIALKKYVEREQNIGYGDQDRRLPRALRFIEDLMALRKTTKIRGTYADGLLNAVDAYGRVSTGFKIHGTVTGRVSSANPNLQNIPSPRNPIGTRVRQLFRPNPGHKWVKIDGSQMELRVLAYLAQSETLKEIYRTGGDIHKVTMMSAVMPVVLKQDRGAVDMAAKIIGVGYGEAEGLLREFLRDYPELPKESELYEAFRRFSKTINFGIIYGMGASTLAEELGVSGKVAQSFLNNLLKTHPAIGTYMNKQEYMAFNVGEIISPLGFRRQFGFVPRDGKNRTGMRNHAYNNQVQGTAGLLTLLAGVDIQAELMRRGWSTPRTTIGPNDDAVEMKLTVHDEWDFSVREDVVDEFISVAVPIFEATPAKYLPGLDFPFKADAKVGDSWGDVR
jgi:DNA polymerase I-like protein with 3'-5' exonuclease and polymerase domains